MIIADTRYFVAFDPLSYPVYAAAGFSFFASAVLQKIQAFGSSGDRLPICYIRMGKAPT